MAVRIYFDFDGTLYEWNPAKSLEDVGSPRYPLIEQKSLAPVIFAANKLDEDFPGAVRICSAVLNEGCLRAKKCRIAQDLNKDIAMRSVFTSFGEDKIAAMHLRNRKRVGIKVYNGVNGNHGRWLGYSIHSNSKPTVCYKQLKAIIDSIILEYEDVDILIDDFTKNLKDWAYE